MPYVVSTSETAYSISERNVCRGTRPSRYHSVRAISMPFSRPELLILMPCAPRRIAFCIAHFLAIDMHRDAHSALQLSFQQLDVFAFFTDDNAWPRAMNRNPGIFCGTFNHNPTHRRRFQLLPQIITHIDIFFQHLRKLRICCIPARDPVVSDRQTETCWMYFLSHVNLLISNRHSNVTCLLLDSMTAPFGARPRTLE